MAIREGRWDCTACGRVANLGRDLRCAGCGRARGNVKFYLPADEPAVREAELRAIADAGPDWACGFCEASNRSTSEACTGCGAPRADGSSRVVGGADADELTHEQKEALERSRRIREEIALASRARRSRNRKLVVAAAAVVFLLCAGGGTFGAFAARLGGTRGEGGPTLRLGAPAQGPEVVLLSKLATRRIAVEGHRLVNEDGWCSSMPGGARELHRETRQSGTRQVCSIRGAERTGGGPILAAAGAFRVQQDLGNGFFSESGGGGGGGSDWGSSSSSDNCTSEPVYSDWCTWEVWRWIVIRTPETTSEVAVPPWPELTLAHDERRGRQAEIYEGTLLSTDGERIRLLVDQSRWLAWQSGTTYEGTWSFFGGLKTVGAPVAATRPATAAR